jgi:DNA-binding MurR/RpiR family transcriptional regulator
MGKTQPSGLKRIRAAYPGLTTKLQSIADQILANPQDVVHLSINELAEVTGSSEATIFRLCKQLGFQGYQDLKITLAQDLAEEPLQNIHEEVNQDDDMMTVAHKVFQANLSGLNDTLNLLDPDALEKAICMIHEADRVEFYGTGGSGPIAVDAYHKLMRTGLNCMAHTDTHMQVMSAGLLPKNSVVVAISHSGSNKDILEACRVAKSAGARILAITSYKRSLLSRLAEVTLYTSTRETNFRTEAISARIAQLCLLDTIYVGLSLLRQDVTLSNLRKIREVISMKRG